LGRARKDQTHVAKKPTQRHSKDRARGPRLGKIGTGVEKRKSRGFRESGRNAGSGVSIRGSTKAQRSGKLKKRGSAEKIRADVKLTPARINSKVCPSHPTQRRGE